MTRFILLAPLALAACIPHCPVTVCTKPDDCVCVYTGAVDYSEDGGLTAPDGPTVDDHGPDDNGGSSDGSSDDGNGEKS